MSIINPLAAIVPMSPASAWQPPREGREHDLRLEQIVRASVAEGGQERVLLEMGQRRFWAETATPLKTGQTLSLQVVATAPRLELKVVADPLSDRLGRLLHLLGGKMEMAGVLKQLLGEQVSAGGAVAGGRDVLAPLLELLETSPEALTGDTLWRLLRKLTPNLLDGEGSMAVRQALQTAHQQLVATKDPQAEEVARLLQQLDLSMLCHARLAQAGMLFLPLSLPFLEYGYMLAEQRQPNGEPEAHSSLSLHLSLRGLGDLRVDLLYEDSGLFLRFCCSSAAATAFMAGFHEELQTRFRSFPLRGVSFVGGAESPVQTLLRRLLPIGEGVLNTRV